MRKISGSYRVLQGNRWVDVQFENGAFHCCGAQSTEYENGGVTDTVAIVELPDSSIVTPYPRNIVFLDRNSGVENV